MSEVLETLTFTVGDTVKQFKDQKLYDIPAGSVATVSTGNADLVLSLRASNLSEVFPSDGALPDISGRYTVAIRWYDHATSLISTSALVSENIISPDTFDDTFAIIRTDIPSSARSFVIHSIDSSGLVFVGANSASRYSALEIDVTGIFIDIGNGIQVLDTSPLAPSIEGGGTTVVANPSGMDGADLDRIAIDGTNYNLAGGTEVEANPSGIDGTALTRIRIDGSNYIIEGGSSGDVTADTTILFEDTVGSVPTRAHSNWHGITLTQAPVEDRLIVFEVIYDENSYSYAITSDFWLNYTATTNNVTTGNLTTTATRQQQSVGSDRPTHFFSLEARDLNGVDTNTPGWRLSFRKISNTQILLFWSDDNSPRIRIVELAVGGGSGSGSVDQAARNLIAAETTRRVAGDDLQSISVSSVASFQSAETAQATSDEPLEIVFRTTVVINAGTAQQETYNVGDVLYYAPRSSSPERRFNIVTHTELTKENKERREGDEINEYNNINSASVMTTSLTAHNSTPADVLRAGLFVITGTFTTSARTYASGQRWYLAPYHTTEGNMVLLSEAGSGGGGTDATARASASAAQKLASENKTRLDALPNYAAQLTVNPPNVRQHSGFQRKFQSTLTALDPALATNGGSTGTRFTNVFRIFTRLSDGTVVQLHTQGWAFTSDDRQSIAWEVDASEFNSIGTTSATTGIEVWGEFRAVYGGGVNEFRGRTNPVFIDFGEEDAWPATRGDLKDISTSLSTAQLIALLTLIPDPGSITFTGQSDLMTKVKTIRIDIPNPELLTGDIWVLGYTQGQPAIGARTKWASSLAGLNIVIADASADAVASALITDSDPQVEVRLRFYDKATGGNEIERVGVNIPIVLVPLPATWVQSHTTGNIRATTNAETTLQTLTITPRSASQPIHLAAHLDCNSDNATSNNIDNRDIGFEVRLYRGSDLLIARHKQQIVNRNQNLELSLDLDWLDTNHNSNSAITYTLRGVRRGSVSWTLSDRQIIAHEAR